MKLEIFSVYDSKAQAYLPPFFLPNEAMAKRVFADMANDPKHAFGANSADYTLFHLGNFNDETAQILVQGTPESLGIAQEFKSPTQKDAPEQTNARE